MPEPGHATIFYCSVATTTTHKRAKAFVTRKNKQKTYLKEVAANLNGYKATSCNFSTSKRCHVVATAVENVHLLSIARVECNLAILRHGINSFS